MDREEPGILHVDMDAFFASVEVRDNPSLRGLPVVVGGAGARGVVAAASYPARAHGIRSAMPMAVARRRAPDLVIVPPRIERYRAISRQVMAILHDVTPAVEQISVDEAFLDVRGARRLLGPAETIAARVRQRVREELDLPCSVGGSVSRPVAKIASAHAKPDGMLIIPAESTADFLAPLPVGVISGVGPKAQEALARLGVRTIGQMRAVPATTLRRALGPSAPTIDAIARGEDRTGLGTRTRDKSLGTERTWDEDLTEPARIRREVTLMADAVGRSLRAKGLAARSLTLKLRAPDGTTLTRSSTFSQPTSSGERLREHAVALWEREEHRMPRVRLAGVRAEQIGPAASEARELTGRTRGWQDLETAMDRAVERFGSASLARGSTLAPPTAEHAVQDSPPVRGGGHPGDGS